MRPQFRIIIPVFNAAAAVGENIAMLRDQSYPHFHCVLIDDRSTDDTVDVVTKAISGDDRFELIVNSEKKYALRNAAEAIGEFCKDDHEVIVPVDGDDRLMHADVLARVADAYADDGCWLTYGSYANEHGERGKECSPYPTRVVSQGSFRDHAWRATHLKTFKRGLWRHVPSTALQAARQEQQRVRTRALLRCRFRAWYRWRGLRGGDLHDPSGRCFRRCYDKAIMYPMLELAAAHAVHIPEILYRYRSCNPQKEKVARSSEAKWGTRCIQQILRQKPPLEPLVSF